MGAAPSLANARAACWLSVVCCTGAMLVAVPSALCQFKFYEWINLEFGEHLSREYAFKETERMLQRERFTVEFDESTVGLRLKYLGLLTPNHINVLLFFPCVFVYYLGVSLRACATLFGFVAAFMGVVVVGYGVFGNKLLLRFSPALSFVALICALSVICPRGSGVPLQAAKQALAVTVGNLVVLNVIPERTVSAEPRPLLVANAR